MHIGDYLLLALLGLGVWLAIRHLRRHGSCGSCNGDCAHCRHKRKD